MRTMHSPSCRLVPFRASRRLALAALWLGCTLLPALASAINVPPVLSVTLDKQVNEGQLLDFSGTNGAPPLARFVDPDLGDTHVAAIYWGDGTAIQMATVFPSVGSGPLGGSHYYADNGNNIVTLSVADDAGASASQMFRVLVNNVNPTLGVTPSPTSIGVGQLVSFNAAFSDPGFGNPLNTLDPTNGGELDESFRYSVAFCDR